MCLQHEWKVNWVALCICRQAAAVCCTQACTTAWQAQGMQSSSGPHLEAFKDAQQRYAHHQLCRRHEQNTAATAAMGWACT